MEEAQVTPEVEIQRTADTLTKFLLQLQEARSGKRKVSAAPVLFKASERDTALRAIENVKNMASSAAILVASLPDLLITLQDELAAVEDGPINTPTGLSYASPIPKEGLSTRAINALSSCNIRTLRDLCALEAPDLMKMRNMGQVTYNEIVAYRAQLGVPM